MKRYLVFYGDQYYPSPGMEDFISDFDTLEESEQAIAVHKITKGYGCLQWSQIYDTETRTIVKTEQYNDNEC